MNKKPILCHNLAFLLLMLAFLPIKETYAIKQCLAISNVGNPKIDAWWIPGTSFAAGAHSLGVKRYLPPNTLARKQNCPKV